MWTLLDTGLRVGEFSSLSRDSIDWQGHRLMIYGKGGPYGTKSKRRIIPLTARVTLGLDDETIEREFPAFLKNEVLVAINGVDGKFLKSVSRARERLVFLEMGEPEE